ncbi:MAG: CoA ester lyase [Gammaproteobacteria bacterium]|nr:CoA ester lyase [Gammaproteobacteria bacterium]
MPASGPIRARRSLLFVPASNARALDKARTLPVDVVIMDLEDAVAPERKAEARAQLAAELGRGGYGQRERVVRVNAIDGTVGAEDLACVARLPLDAVLLPKVETDATVRAAAAALDRAGAPANLPLWIMIETPAGVLEARAICAASPRLACVVMGTSDLARDLRQPHTPDRVGLVPALLWCVLAARAAGLDIVDGVHLDLRDDDGLERACRQGRALGFDGKTLIHPAQIAACHRAFTPSTEEIDAARCVLDAWHDARARGDGVAVVNGRLVEALHVEEARRTLALAEAIAQAATQAPPSTSAIS